MKGFSQGRSYWGVEWGVAPPAFENFVFVNTKPKKSTFSGLFSYSIYLKEDITPPLLLKNLTAKELRPWIFYHTKLILIFLNI